MFSLNLVAMTMWRVCKFVILTFLALAAAPSLAQYPDRPIKLIVPWPPGGASDVLARYVGAELGSLLGQPVVVENKAGANGIVGTQAAARMPADGYSFLGVTAETHAINPAVYVPLPYDPLTDFDPLGMVAHVSLVLAVRADLAPNNMNELLDFARLHPGKLSAGSYGVGSTSHLGLATLEALTKTTYAHIPYLGVSPTVNALLAGQIDLAFVNAFNVEQFYKSGKIKILGVAGDARLPTIPAVPTMAEQGLAGLSAGNWYGFVAPHGVPDAIQRQLAAAIRQVAQSAGFREKANTLGMIVDYRDGPDFAKHMRAEGERLGKIAHDKSIELRR